MIIQLQFLRPALAAACVAGAALLSTPALAHDAHAHHQAQMAKADSEDYVRSERAYSVPDVVLTDADARPVRLRQLLASEDPVMMNFIFTTCGTICPVMSKVFSDVPATLGEQAKTLRMVSISIDPENDTPSELKAYAKRFSAGPRWEFLTGSVRDVKVVQLAFDSYRGDKMNHEPLTLLHAAPGKPWVRIDGFASSQALAEEYHKATGR
jgi:protein SCO1/2